MAAFDTPESFTVFTFEFFTRFLSDFFVSFELFTVTVFAAVPLSGLAPTVFTDLPISSSATTAASALAFSSKFVVFNTYNVVDFAASDEDEDEVADDEVEADEDDEPPWPAQPAKHTHAINAASMATNSFFDINPSRNA